MTVNAPVVRPVCNARSPVLGPQVILAASHMDLKLLAARLQLPDMRHLYMSRVYFDARHKERAALAGPFMGAPYAAMMLEVLHAWGVEKALFLGWCGSIDPAYRVGDIVIPTSALIDEGTSLHYRQEPDSVVYPDQHQCDALMSDCSDHHIVYKTARVWSTDAIFRETPEKIAAFQRQGAHVVEMELSAIFSVAAFHAMAAAGILVVSDELFTLNWTPGFKNSIFLSSRDQIIERLSKAALPFPVEG